MRYLGIDLAWRSGPKANETGVVGLDSDGGVLAASWTTSVSETFEWIQEWATGDTVCFVDAPLVVDNPSGMRECERQVGQRYGRWRVAANATNLTRRHLAGVELREHLEHAGWRYDDGFSGPPTEGRVLSECYPYATLVGVPELGYDLERPRYKRKPKALTGAVFKPVRAAACDELVRCLANLAHVDPPLRLGGHAVTWEPQDQGRPDWSWRREPVPVLGDVADLVRRASVARRALTSSASNRRSAIFHTGATSAIPVFCVTVQSPGAGQRVPLVSIPTLLIL